MPDVEFLTGDGSGSDDEEVLDTGPRRRVPWWAMLLGALVLVALVGTVLVADHRHSEQASPAPTPTAPAPVVSTAPVRATGPILGLVSDPVNHRVLALRGSAVVAYDTARHVVRVSALLASAGSASGEALLFDSRTDVVWVVQQGLSTLGREQYPRLAQAFSGRTLGPVASVPLPGSTEGFAVLDGWLYAIGVGELYRTRPGDTSFDAVSPLGTGEDILIADPTRHRLLIGRIGAHPRLETWSPGKPVSLAKGSSVALPFAEGQVLVADGTIWAGGTSAKGRAVLERLDPRTLHAGRNVASGLIPDGHRLALAGTGQHSLFVRPSASRQLVCLDSRDGALRGPVDWPRRHVHHARRSRLPGRRCRDRVARSRSLRRVTVG